MESNLKVINGCVPDLYFFSNINLSAIFQSILRLIASNFLQSFLIHCMIPQLQCFWILNIQFSGIQQKLVILPILAQLKMHIFANKQLFVDQLYVGKEKVSTYISFRYILDNKSQNFRNLEYLTIFLILPKKIFFCCWVLFLVVQ